MKRFLSALLALLTVGSLLASCAGDGGTSSDTTSSASAETTVATETTTSDPNSDDLPDGLDFGGRAINFYIPSNLNIYFEGPEEDTGDVVDEAVLLRNMTVEERLNVDITSVSQTSSDVRGDITNLILSGDETYDMFVYMQHIFAQMVLEGSFMNVKELDYVDFEKSYWDLTYMNELSLNPEKFYLINGDYFIDSLLMLNVIFYNKQMYGDHYGDPNGIYNTILDGDWTMDEMTKLIADEYVDTNNNGMTDIYDRLGQVCWALAATVDPFVYGSDIQFTKRNSDGSVEFTMMSDDSTLLTEKLNAMLHQPGNLVLAERDHIKTFKNGNTLFLGSAKFTYGTELRDMETDFGFLPFPKFDDAQDDYKSLLADAVSIGAVPITTPNADILGAVLEALNAESSRTVVPAWYETALKVKYTRDDISSQMIDLIHDSATTNFIFAYNYALNDLGLIHRTLVQNNSNDFASTYASREPTAIAALDELTAFFNK